MTMAQQSFDYGTAFSFFVRPVSFGRCEQQFPFNAWGEDKYMTNCLESLGSRTAAWRKKVGLKCSF